MSDAPQLCEHSEHLLDKLVELLDGKCLAGAALVLNVRDADGMTQAQIITPEFADDPVAALGGLEYVKQMTIGYISQRAKKTMN